MRTCAPAHLRTRAALLTAEQRQELVRTGLHLERLLDAPQDVEWVFAAHRLWILQSRDVGMDAE